MKLATKLILTIVSLALIVVALSGYLIYAEGEKRWNEDLDNRLKNAAVVIAESIDQDSLDQIKRPSDIFSEAYYSAQKPLQDLLLASNLDWAGILYKEGDRFYYWIDYDDTGVAYPFFYATPEHFAAYQDQQPHRIAYTDEFGSYYGYVAPIIKKDSNPPVTLALVEIDISQDAATLIHEENIRPLILIILMATLIFAIITFLSIHFAVRRPLLRLRNWAAAVSSGNFSADITIRSRDELYDLSIAFRQLVNYMRQIARAADRITQGDLTTHVYPKSDQDVLGHAFVRLSGYLANLASAASHIAEGNLDVTIPLQSDKDVLGRAFNKMAENLKSTVAEIVLSAESLSSASHVFLDGTQKAGESILQITTSIQQVAQKTNEQAGAIEGIAKGAQEQLASTTTASQTSTQMSEAIQQVAESAQVGMARAGAASQAANAGMERVQEVIREMGRIREKAVATATSVAEMSAGSNKILTMAETIDEISAETKVLSLNAAIAAAHAGEHGREFGVVAEEVHRLANRVSTSTREIHKIVKSLRKSIDTAETSMAEGSAEVQAGVECASEAGQALSQILESITVVVQQAESISHAANGIAEMSQGLLQSMDAVSSVSKENSETTHQMAENATEVKNASETVGQAAMDISSRVNELIASASTLADMARELETSAVQFKL